MISKKKLLSYYETMLLIRKCEESFVDPILNGEIKCPVHLYTGQEAIAVGISAHLNTDDIIFGNHRSHGHYLAKGGDLYKMIAEIYCREDGCAEGRGGSMHIISKEVGMLGAAPIVAGTIALALGGALSLKLSGSKNIAVAYFGDGATGEGVLFESINFAAMRKLPILFVCENNYYSTHLPVKETRPDTPIFHIGKSFGIPSFQVDGNDLQQTLKFSKKAVDICRNGIGPVFIEFKTYRMHGHVGPSDSIQGTQTDIRPNSEIEAWRRKDPIERFEKYLLENKICTIEDFETITLDVESRIQNAHKKAIVSSQPAPEELTRYVFK